jgi:hypothetical protein
MKSLFILLVIGTFISAAQSALSRPAETGSAPAEETCFGDPGMLDLSAMTIDADAPYSAGAHAYADTLETYEIELEDEGSKGINYKAIVGLTIAAAIVGYYLVTVILPDEEEEEEETGGKEPPVSIISIPF